MFESSSARDRVAGAAAASAAPRAVAVVPAGSVLPGHDGVGSRVAAGRDSVAALTRAAAELAEAATACGAWSGGDRVSVLDGLDRVAGVLATARARLLVAEKEAGTSVTPGDRDFTAARARSTRSGYGQAARELAQASTLVAMPAVADAVADGRVPLAHVEALARVSSGASAEGAAVLESAAGQDEVVELARRLPVKDFAARVAQLVATHDPAGLEADVAAQRRARFLHLSHQPDGTRLRGRLDRMSGELLRIALAAAGQAPDETRDKAQADADALMAVVGRATSGMAGIRARRTDGTGRRVLPDPAQDAADARVSGVAGRPHLSVIVPAETFAELRGVGAGGADAAGAVGRPGGAGAVGRPGAAGGAGAVGQADAAAAIDQAGAVGEAGRAGVAVAGASGRGGSGGQAVPPATLEDGTPVAMSDLARLLCDCDIARIVVGADSVPVDLGRTQRLYPAAHRRAVIVRDRHCSWDGCAVPAAYCDVHHIRWWTRDRGPTSLDNAVLLCDHHHHVVHALDLRIERVAGPPGSSAAGAARRGAGPATQGRTSATATQGEPVRYRFSRRDGRVVSPSMRVSGAPPPTRAGPVRV
ncbi:hypothetical protein [Cellulomonas hominis]